MPGLRSGRSQPDDPNDSLGRTGRQRSEQLLLRELAIRERSAAYMAPVYLTAAARHGMRLELVPRPAVHPLRGETDRVVRRGPPRPRRLPASPGPWRYGGVGENGGAPGGA